MRISDWSSDVCSSDLRRAARSVRSGLFQGLQGIGNRLWRPRGRNSAGMVEGCGGKIFDARGNGEGEISRFLGRDHGDAEKEACGTAGPASRRQEMGRNGRNIYIRTFRL